MKKQDFTLVRGMFNVEDAKEVLMNLIGSKIVHHNKVILRSFECNGNQDHQSEQRIAELNESRNKILQLLKEVDETKQHITINSTIHIEIEE